MEFSGCNDYEIPALVMLSAKSSFRVDQPAFFGLKWGEPTAAFQNASFEVFQFIIIFPSILLGISSHYGFRRFMQPLQFSSTTLVRVISITTTASTINASPTQALLPRIRHHTSFFWSHVSCRASQFLVSSEQHQRRGCTSPDGP